MSDQLTPSKVLLYPANMVTLLRYVLLILFFYSSTRWPVVYVTVGAFGAILDMVDGYVAKVTNKPSRLGAALDMLVDRFYFCFGLAILAHLFSNYFSLFALLILLEFGSHMVLVHACAVMRINSHQALFKDGGSVILSWYYSSRRHLMYALNSSCVIFLVLLYLYYFYPGKFLFVAIVVLSPFYLLQSYVFILQAFAALKRVAHFDVEQPLT